MNLAWENSERRQVTADELAQRLFYFSGSILAREFDRIEEQIEQQDFDPVEFSASSVQEMANELPYFCWYAIRVLLPEHWPGYMDRIQDKFTSILVKEISTLEGETLSRYEIAARSSLEQQASDSVVQDEQIISAAAHVATLHIFGTDLTKQEYEQNMTYLSEKIRPYLLAINDFLYEYEVVDT